MEISDEFSSNQQTPIPPDLEQKSKMQKVLDDPAYHPYIMRSYKAMQALCEVKNVKYITHVDRRAFEKYCNYYLNSEALFFSQFSLCDVINKGRLNL